MIGKIIILRFIVNLSTLPTLFGLKEFFSAFGGLRGVFKCKYTTCF